jgi:polar amino acid transport system substrate-binding protein
MRLLNHAKRAWAAKAGRLAALALALLAAVARADPAPSLWDPSLHLDKPDISGLRAIRFLTSDDYPPLNFARADEALAGFNVDIARAICEELVIGCTIQARRFDTLVDSLEDGKGDAVMASLAATPALRERIDFSQPYYTTPARFAAQRTSPLQDATPATLKGKKVGAMIDSAHEAYLKTFFPGVEISTYAKFSDLAEALKSGAVDAVFADGLTLAIWLGGESSANCCAFKGGPYTESRFFGEGIGVAMRKEDVALRRAIDWALARLTQKGTFAEIYRKYFPVGFY